MKRLERKHALAAVLLLLALELIYGRAGNLGYAGIDDVDYVIHTQPVRAGLTADGVRWAFTAFRAGNFLPALLVLCAISVAAFGWRKRFPWLLFGWLWFLLTLLPVIGLIQVGIQSHADRYMYLPSPGPFLALGAIVTRLRGEALMAALLALAPALACYSYIAWVQIGTWSGPYTHATRALGVVGDTFPLHTMLIGFYLGQGRVREAEEHTMQAFRLSSGSALAYSNLGTVRLRKEDYSLAERMFRTALRKSPVSASTLNNLGIALERQGRLAEARRFFASALEDDPNLHEARENLKRVEGGF